MRQAALDQFLLNTLSIQLLLDLLYRVIPSLRQVHERE